MKVFWTNISLCLTVVCAQSKAPWYHHTSIYQIYPRSFFDSNGDGIGDIQGIIQKLDHIRSLGFETIWCSPFFSSPQKDFGYDISDFRNIAPEYGTLADAEALIAAVHERNMRIVFDMVMNHTSDEHEWFKADVHRPAHERNKNTDFYVWRNKPNNWKSMVSGSAWHFHPQRGQYYYAAFLPFQPDLNYHNPAVQQAMLDNVRFWLAKGVDGFRLDIFNSLFEDSLFRNNPPSLNVQTQFKKPKNTANLPQCLDFAEKLREVCDSFGDKMLIGEIIGDRNTSRKYCGDERNNRLTLAFDFEMLRFKFRASWFEKLIGNLEKDFHPTFMPVYVFSNHDRRRSLSRLKGDVQKAKALHAVHLLARGVPCLYYGEEIGMTDNRLNYKTALDPIPHYLKIPRGIMEWVDETLNRDDVRTPMQWSNEKNAGFSTGNSTWLPINENYRQVHVSTENELQKTITAYMNLRNNLPAISHGDLSIVSHKKSSGKILCFRRTFGSQSIAVCINFSKYAKKLALEKAVTKILLATESPEKIEAGFIKMKGRSVMVFEE